MSLLLDVRRTVRRHKLIDRGQEVVVGVSGGPDSLCLLHVLRALAPELALRLHVAHLNHGLRGVEADADAAFVESLAGDWNLPATVERVDVAALAARNGQGLEEAARHARYTFLAAVAQQAGAHSVAVGHTADDQAETVLMHFLRGSGLAGLRGMLPIVDLGVWTSADAPGFHAGCALIRPLLAVTRAEVLGYCTRHGLTPRFDRSNEDTTFFRNRLRHELLPLLETYNPQIRRILRSSAAVLADDYEHLRGLVSAAWLEVVTQESGGLVVADLGRFRAQSGSVQRGLLREAISRLRSGLRDIGFVHVENALWLAREGQAGDRMTLPAGLEMVLGTARLAIGEAGLDLPLEDAPQLAQPWTDLAIPGATLLPGWRIEAEILAPAGLPPAWQENADRWQAWLDADVLGPGAGLRGRVAGERFEPLGLEGHTKPLAEFFTNAKAPAAARDRWPVLVGSSGQIAWVCGLRVDERAKVTMFTRRVLHVRFVRQGAP